VVGAAVGLGCLAVYVLYRGSVHFFVGSDTRSRDLFPLVFNFWQIVIAIGAQAVAAAIATGLARDAVRLAEGLCAACVTGTIAVFGIAAGPTAAGCISRVPGCRRRTSSGTPGAS
jgi:hypothetical protein